MECLSPTSSGSNSGSRDKQVTHLFLLSVLALSPFAAVAAEANSLLTSLISIFPSWLSSYASRKHSLSSASIESETTCKKQKKTKTGGIKLQGSKKRKPKQGWHWVALCWAPDLKLWKGRSGAYCMPSGNLMGVASISPLNLHCHWGAIRKPFRKNKMLSTPPHCPI